MQHCACEWLHGFKHAGHVAQTQLMRDESQWCAEDLWTLLLMELMCGKDKATEQCHVPHMGSLLVVDRETHRIKRLNRMKDSHQQHLPWRAGTYLYTNNSYFLHTHPFYLLHMCFKRINIPHRCYKTCLLQHLKFMTQLLLVVWKPISTHVMKKIPVKTLYW